MANKIVPDQDNVAASEDQEKLIKELPALHVTWLNETLNMTGNMTGNGTGNGTFLADAGALGEVPARYIHNPIAETSALPLSIILSLLVIGLFLLVAYKHRRKWRDWREYKAKQFYA